MKKKKTKIFLQNFKILSFTPNLTKYNPLHYRADFSFKHLIYSQFKKENTMNYSDVSFPSLDHTRVGDII